MKTERIPEADAPKFTFRQSGINTFLLCPERARQEWFFDLVEEPSDAAILGTALHSSIEADLRDEVPTTADIHQYGQHVLGYLIEDGVRWVNNDEKQIRRMLDNMIDAWRPCPLRASLRLCPVKLEQSFELLFDTDAWGNQLWLTGQMDCVVPVGEDITNVYDWKTAASPYKKWEKQRWAVQPTVYTWASAQLFGSTLPSFEYVVFSKRINDCDIQTIPIERNEGHWDWLRRQLWGITELSPERPWPLNDQHALCSQKWCPFWSECKGMFITE